MMRRLLQPVWVLLAIIFLIEAWLWDHLEPIVAWVVALLPLRTFKQWLAERVDTLSPAMTLIVFIVPVIPLFPLKLVGLLAARPRILAERHRHHHVREIARRRRRRIRLRRDAAETAGNGVVRKAL